MVLLLKLVKTHYFDCPIGVKQGDCLSPTLFAIFMSKLLISVIKLYATFAILIPMKAISLLTLLLTFKLLHWIWLRTLEIVLLSGSKHMNEILHKTWISLIWIYFLFQTQDVQCNYIFMHWMIYFTSLVLFALRIYQNVSMILYLTNFYCMLNFALKNF